MTGQPRIDKPLKVAVAGAGMISWHHLTSWRKLSSCVELVAICDPIRRNAELRAREFAIPAVYESVDDMLAHESVEAIDIATPRATHVRIVEKSADLGLAILCQKPLAPTLSEAEELARKLAPGIRLMVHENWRFRPWYRELKQWVEAGYLGEINHAEIASVDSGLLPGADGAKPHLVRQPFLANESRLMIAEGLIHHLDVLRFLCGSLRVVGARALRTDPDIAGETTATIMLESAHGAAVMVHGSMVAAGHAPGEGDKVRIAGSKASVHFAGGKLELLGAAPLSRTFDTKQGYQASFDSAIAHFVTQLRSGDAFETSLADNLETLRLVEHAYWSTGMHATMLNSEVK